MDVVTLLTVAVLVGWLATLLLHAEIDHISVFNFSIAVLGAALAGGLIAPALGISPTGDYGLSLPGTVISGVGAMTLLAAVNLLRYGRLRCGRRRMRRAARMQPLIPRNH
jgi:uncharacterized membrane protein YeaQ/YmgE (transglycosylase-associated protein family)